jgi:hypothetical protein
MTIGTAMLGGPPISVAVPPMFEPAPARMASQA